MKRLLCIVGGMNAGGAETFLMKLYRNLDRSRYQMDFCVSKPEKGFYDDEILSMGGRILHTTPKSRNPLGSFLSIYRIVRQGEYHYVMRVSQHSLSAMELVAAGLGGAKVRVFRSSNSKTMRGGFSRVLHRGFRFLPNVAATVKIAPSEPAAEFMFGKKAADREVLYLNNGIPLRNYAFCEEDRQRIREELGLSDQLLVGHIGRLTEQKNHKKLLQIFAELHQENPEAHLMMVGEGELEDSIRAGASELGLSDRIHFMGVRKDIPALLSAMDVFVFPSLYEGMPNTVIEAQANGVPCVIADTITSEAMICENVRMLSLENTEDWLHCIRDSRRLPSEENAARLQEKGYDIRTVVNVFTKSVFSGE